MLDNHGVCIQKSGAAPKPGSSYCGGAPGYVDNLRVDFNTSSALSISCNAQGSSLSCPDEAYTVGASGDITLPNDKKSDDCLNEKLSTFGLDPSALQIQFKNDTVVIDVESIVSITLKPCK
jgi:hypothetical protein